MLVQDKLFATLDPTTRRLSLPGGREALLTDTVGFIRKLPRDLVAAFRATLEGVEEASLIVHVVDSSHPHASELVSTVDSVLASLNVGSTPRLIAWNKIDLLANRLLPTVHTPAQADSIAISAKTGENLDALLARIEKMLGEALVQLRVVIPYDRYDLVGLLYEQAAVEKREDAAQGIRLLVTVPKALAERLAEFADRARGMLHRIGPRGLARRNSFTRTTLLQSRDLIIHWSAALVGLSRGQPRLTSSPRRAAGAPYGKAASSAYLSRRLG